MDKLFSIVISILIFCVIIVFHEFGHLLLAKKNGIAVPEFTVGFGPKLFGFKIGETEYNFRLILLGGACRMLGEDGDSTDDRSFPAQSVGARFATVFAGPFFNFILAFILAVIVIGTVGYDPCIVTSVAEGGAGDAAGLKPGDLITSFDGDRIRIGRELAITMELDGLTGDPVEIEYERDGKSFVTTLNPELHRSYKLGFYYSADDSPAAISNLVSGGVFEQAGVKIGDVIRSVNGHATPTGAELYDFITANPLDNSELELVISRGDVTKTLVLTPAFTENYEHGFTFNYNAREKTTPLNVLRYGLIEVRYWIVNTVKSLGMLVTGRLGSKDLGGPVRIVSELENTVEQSKEDGALYVFLNLLNWGILLSANLGVMNLLPIPALDGGRLVFIILEAIRRKKIPPEKEGLVHGIGIVFLLILMVFVFFNDLRNVFF